MARLGRARPVQPFIASGAWRRPQTAIPTVGFRIGGVTGLTLYVEAAFGYGPLDNTPVFQNLSEWVQGISTSRGKNDTRSDYQPGSASIRLLNVDRRFDPTFIDSPYYVGGATQILPMVPVRIRVQKGATVYPIWYGYADAWQPHYELDPADGTGYATVELSCTEAFKVLGLYQLPDSVWAATIIAEAPVAWWRLGETSGIQMIDSSGNGRHGIYEGGATFRSREGLLPYSPDHSIDFEGVASATVNQAVLSSGTWTVELWFQTATGATLFWHGAPTYNQYTRIFIADGSVAYGAAADAVFVEMYDGSATPVFRYVTAAGYADDEIHHLMVTYDGNAPVGEELLVYIDGTLSALPDSYGPGGGPAITDYGTACKLGVWGTNASIDGFLDEVVVYDRTLTAADAAAHHQAGHAPWDDDTAGTRVGRLLDEVGWPSALRELDTGLTTFGGADLDDTAISAMRDVEATEMGALFVTRSGNIRFRDRTSLRTDTVLTVPQAVFGDGADGEGGTVTGEIPYSSAEVDYSETHLVNRCEVRTTQRKTYVAADQDSIDRYGTRSLSRDVPACSDAFAVALAQHEVYLAKDPYLRVTRLTVPIVRTRDTTGAALDIFDAILNLELGYRCTVHRAPPGGGRIEFDCHLERVAHRITPHSWTADLHLGAADPNTYVIVGTSLVGDGSIVGY